jgi:omega-6 fatty acid desaturase (delta-12 desaturase)
MATNAAIGLVVGALIWLIGVKALVVVYLPALLLAASMGVWLFYVQHQFEEMTWSEGESWSLHEAALHGSSLRSADGAALGNRQHRHSPRAPSLQPYSLLSATAGAARSSRPRPDRPAHMAREPVVRAARAVG